MVFIDVDLVCKKSRKINFWISHDQFNFINRLSAKYLSKNLILVKKLSLLEIDHFDVFDSEKKNVEERDGMDESEGACRVLWQLGLFFVRDDSINNSNWSYFCDFVVRKKFQQNAE